MADEGGYASNKQTNKPDQRKKERRGGREGEILQVIIIDVVLQSAVYE